MEFWKILPTRDCGHHANLVDRIILADRGDSICRHTQGLRVEDDLRLLAADRSRTSPLLSASHRMCCWKGGLRGTRMRYLIFCVRSDVKLIVRRWRR